MHKALLRDGRLVAVKVQHRHAARQIPIASWQCFGARALCKDVAYMRLLARFAWVLTLGEVDLMPVVRVLSWRGHLGMI